MLQISLLGVPTVKVFCTGKNSVLKITCSSSEVVLRTTKHTMIYPGSGSSLEVIALRQPFEIEDEQVIQRGEQRAQEVHVVMEEMDVVPVGTRVRLI
jgi:hypothetical protein